ncbi:MAG TPA: hypothetical protein VG712_01925, partial [Gemmatimonadales bacterium]|nr:hypothetical protein [Gemmatimonadales bacterium]
LALLGAVGGCGGGGGDGSSAEPGFLDLTLNTPNADDGALLFKVVGGTVDSVVAGAMVQDGSYAAVTGGTRIVVAGNLTDGIVARVHVPDVNDAGDYSVVIEQVAVRNTFTQRSLTGYSMAVSAP